MNHPPRPQPIPPGWARLKSAHGPTRTVPITTWDAPYATLPGATQEARA